MACGTICISWSGYIHAFSPTFGGFHAPGRLLLNNVGDISYRILSDHALLHVRWDACETRWNALTSCDHTFVGNAVYTKKNEADGVLPEVYEQRVPVCTVGVVLCGVAFLVVG